MRRFLLLLALAPALAIAQPTAADSALVDRLLAAQRLDEAGVSVRPGGEPATGGLADSARATLFEDLRPDLIRRALETLEGRAYQRIQQTTAEWMRGRDPRSILAGIQAPEPSDAPLADSALVARYVHAVLDATQPEDVKAEALEAALQSLSPEMQDRIDPNILQIVRRGLSPEEGTSRSGIVRITRLQLADADPADIQALTAYFESKAGRYVGRRLSIARYRAARAPLRGLLEEMAGRELAQVQPELIGGLEGLQALVVYPDEARRQGIEGSVVVQMVVNERGEPTDLVALRTPSPILSEAALDAVRQSRFVPGMHRGRPVKVRFAVPVTFRLR